MLASFANTAGGLVLIGSWVWMWQGVPIVVVFIGGALFIQGAYTILYAHGELEPWGDVATGALFAGEALASCVGISGLVQTILHNFNTGDFELAPALASAMMLVQALLAMSYLVLSGRLRPRTARSTRP